MVAAGGTNQGKMENTMTSKAKMRVAERGVILMVVVFIATAVAALAAISSGRTVHASKEQRVLEDGTRANNSAYAQLHMALNVVNLSAYNAENQNVEIRNAIAGFNGGSVAGIDAKLDPLSVNDPEFGADRLASPAGIDSGYVAEDSTTAQSSSLDKQSTDANWFDDPAGVTFGFIQGTNVRVYRARDYIKRLQKLKGETVEDVDPMATSDSYFVLESAGRSGATVRMMSALIRETEPFSSFVFFQNRSTLGVSGSPRGLIHANDQLAFYFPNGNYTDPVSSVNGFAYQAGATQENTNILDGNSAATQVSLDNIDFTRLKAEADLFTGTAGLDAEILFTADGRARIREYTKPRFEMIERSYTYDKYVGFHYETATRDVQVKVGEVEVSYTVDEITGYNTETYSEMESVLVGTVLEDYQDQYTPKPPAAPPIRIIEPFIAPTFLKPDFDSLKQGVKQSMREQLRREPTDSEMRELTSWLDAEYRAQYDVQTQGLRGEYDARVAAFQSDAYEAGQPTYGSGGELRDVDPTAGYAEEFEDKFSGELDLIKRNESTLDAQVRTGAAIGKLTAMVNRGR